ncbi:hypothetical protein CAOG_01180 [Capsaspora owczarzaki ATCC 30864]|uniref:Sugar phosphate transporter domain-containing protein n=1 Tax=Capsaspora owczarzaki (strain ATCC 30864) TaxID=595528 RepID=A0A0D2U3G7_CAPO3|nr:hypothetical protein CAOG_01180 [Capsaspora owczarzaki ATCC 30864]KJE89751.1 hypothetical protein CAOG_001180 [Capsaspora owczarzaki ATCC 30864]|eukprot:XP_004366051.2 hypothetical protein CAOG_01180 [Capsaspora owczarzaki ATCC 30864]
MKSSVNLSTGNGNGSNGSSSSSSSSVNGSSSASTSLLLVASILCNIICSVGIVLVNKRIAVAGFVYMTFLTALHFAVAFGVMTVVVRLGVVEHKFVRFGALFPVVAGCVGSVVASNFALAVNSVTTYQLAKLITIPSMLAIEYMMSGKLPSKKIAAILTVMLIAVSFTTSLDLSLTPAGCVIAIAMVAFTSIGQIATQQVQKRQGLNAMQLLHQTSPYNTLALLVLAPFFDGSLVTWLFAAPAAASTASTGSSDSPATTQPGVVPLWEFQPTGEIVGLILISALLSIGVNLTNYYVVARTSPVTYQVLGHVKNCLVLTLGVILFSQQLVGMQVLGIIVAVGTAILYSETRRKEAERASSGGSGNVPVLRIPAVRRE